MNLIYPYNHTMRLIIKLQISKLRFREVMDSDQITQILKRVTGTWPDLIDMFSFKHHSHPYLKHSKQQSQGIRPGDNLTLRASTYYHFVLDEAAGLKQKGL